MKLTMHKIRKFLGLCVFFLYVIYASTGNILIKNLNLGIQGLYILLYIATYNRLPKGFGFALTALICMCANSFLIGNVQSSFIIYSFVTILFGSSFANEDNQFNSRDAMYYSLIVYLSIVIGIAVGGIQSVFRKASTNYISVYTLMPTVVYYIFCEREEKDIKLLPAIICFAFSLLGAGRGGVIASGLLLVFVCLYTTFYLKQNRLWVLAFIIIVLILLIFLYDRLLLILFPSFYSMGFADTGRLTRLEQYFTLFKSSNLYKLFGVPLNQIAILVYRGDNNIHNSFIDIHANYGIFIFSMIVFMIVTTVTRLIKKTKWISLGCVMCILVRGFFDRVFFGEMYYGTMVFVFILSTLRKKEKTLPT